MNQMVRICTREVKTLSTKQYRCWDSAKCLRMNTCACMEKSTGGKTSGTRRGTIPCSTTQVDILWRQRRSGYAIPTSGNICGWICRHMHMLGKSY